MKIKAVILKLVGTTVDKYALANRLAIKELLCQNNIHGNKHIHIHIQWVKEYGRFMNDNDITRLKEEFIPIQKELLL